MGDRLLLCSDGACGSLTDDQMLAVLADGSPDSAALSLVQDALDAGSTDNVTCVVADVVPADQPPDPESAAVDDTGALVPLLVGAAAELPRRGGRGAVSGLFRSSRHDHGHPDAGGAAADLPPEAAHAIPSDPIDPERARYAPRPPRRFCGCAAPSCWPWSSAWCGWRAPPRGRGPSSSTTSPSPAAWSRSSAASTPRCQA